MSEAAGSSADGTAGGDSWVYFVGFAHSSGFGDLVIGRDAPISGPADVEEIRGNIGEWQKVSGVKILSFLLLPSGVGSDERAAG